MNMPDDKDNHRSFEMQAKECETYASAHPNAYRYRVIGLAILGYAYPLIVLVTLVVSFAFLFWFLIGNRHYPGGWIIQEIAVSLLFVIIIIIPMVIKAMLPKFIKPEGIRLNDTDEGEFFLFIETIRRKVGNPKLHRIYLSDELNAALAQTPRLGFFGWYRNDLIIGLPLLQSLSIDEFASVVAHEFGHLSGAHGKFGSWIFRTRSLMANILVVVESKKGFASWIFRKFYHWFEPYFAAFTFTLARRQEYESDSLAASITSPQNAIDALVRSKIANSYMEQIFWDEIWNHTKTQISPPEQIYEALGNKLVSTHTWEDERLWYNEKLKEITDYSDTHPCLSDRAEFLGIKPEIPLPVDRTAISLLHDNGAKYIKEFSTIWRNYNKEFWKDSFLEFAEEKEILIKLDNDAEHGKLSDDDAITQCILTEKFNGEDAALERIEAHLKHSNNVYPLIFAKGRLLLDFGRDEGLAFLDRAMDNDEDAIQPGCELAEYFLYINDRHDQMHLYRQRREAYEKYIEKDLLDRTTIEKNARLLPHNCDDQKLADTLNTIDTIKKKVKFGWLVRKKTIYRKSVPAYMLIFSVSAYLKWNDKVDDLQNELSDVFSYDENITVFVCDVGQGWLQKMAEAVDNSKIFPR